MTPKISIITPSYNQYLFIEQSIQSVLSQKYPNLEYIMLDNLSNDGTQDILNKYKSNFTVLKVEKDKGQSDALIKGFNIASGDIYCWLNSDDILMPNALQFVAKKFIETKCDVLYGLFNRIDENNNLIKKECGKKLNVNEWFKMPMQIGQPSTFFSSLIYKKVGGINIKFNYCMDYDLFMRFAVSNAKFVFVNEVFSSFRQHNNSKTVKSAYKFWLEEFEIYFKNNGKLISPFLYWKGREIISYLMRK